MNNPHDVGAAGVRPEPAANWAPPTGSPLPSAPPAPAQPLYEPPTYHSPDQSVPSPAFADPAQQDQAYQDAMHQGDMHQGDMSAAIGLQDPVRPDGPADPSRPVRHDPAVRAIMEWVPLLLGAFVIAMLVRLFVFQAYSIPSGSMIPTLQVEDRVVVNKLSYNFHDVNRGDMVVFKRPADFTGTYEDLIKRVIGLGGETISFRSGNVYIDGQLVQESYIDSQDSTFPLQNIPGCVSSGSSAECAIPEGHVFVMGDNRRSSTDARVFGPIPEESIVGRAFVKLWPLNQVSLL